MTDPAQADMIVAAFSDALTDATDQSAVLRDWSARYPDLQPDFADFLVDRVFGSVLPGDTEPSGESALVPQNWGGGSQSDLTRKIMSNLLATNMDAPVVAAVAEAETLERDAVEMRPIGLAEAAVSCGIRFPSELASRLRLPDEVVQAIARGRIDMRSLPVALIEQLQTILVAAKDEVLQWLGKPAGSASAFSVAPAFVREDKAAYNVSVDFASALDNAVGWEPADRQYWASVMQMSRRIEE